MYITEPDQSTKFSRKKCITFQTWSNLYRIVNVLRQQYLISQQENKNLQLLTKNGQTTKTTLYLQFMSQKINNTPLHTLLPVTA